MNNSPTRLFVPTTCLSALKVLRDILAQNRIPLFREHVTPEIAATYYMQHRNITIQVTEAIRELESECRSVSYQFGPFAGGVLMQESTTGQETFYSMYNRFHSFVRCNSTAHAAETLEQWLQMWLQLIRDIGRGLFESERIYGERMKEIVGESGAYTLPL